MIRRVGRVEELAALEGQAHGAGVVAEHARRGQSASVQAWHSGRPIRRTCTVTGVTVSPEVCKKSRVSVNREELRNVLV